MAETIDSLVIEIDADADSAHAGIDALTNSLAKLKTATSGGQSGLKKTSENLKSISSAVSGLQNIGNIDRLATSLSNISNTKISSSLGKNLNSIVTASEKLNHIDYGNLATNISKLSTSVQGLSAIPKTNLGALVSALTKLPQAARGIRNMGSDGSLARFKNDIITLNNTMAPLAAKMSAIGTAFAHLPRNINSASDAVENFGNNAVSSGNKSNLLSNSVSKITKLAGSIFAIEMVTNALKSFVDNANKYIENVNLFTAAMGKYSEAALSYATTVQNAMGIDMSEWIRNQGVFQTLITGMGETADRANVMSQQLTQLGYDISSFFNMPVEDAMLKIQSGVAGELEPLRRIGWDLSNARMQAEATKLGIEQNVTTMTQAEKVALRYYMIMTQVTTVHGDMARTLQTPANQLRIFQAQVQLAARAIGNLLIPAMNAILPVAIGFMKVIQMVCQSISDFFGLGINFEVDYSGLDTSGIATGDDTEAIDETSDSIGGIGDAADDSTEKVKELKRTIMGFDEINKLNDITDDSSSGNSGSGDSGSGGTSGGKVGDIEMPQYDFLKGISDAITKLSDDIAKKMLSLIPVIAGVGAGFAAWKISKAIFENLDTIKDKMKDLKDSAKDLSNKISNEQGISNKLKSLKNSIASVASGFLSGEKGAAAMSAAVAVAVAIMVARFVQLAMYSDKFRKGLEVIGSVISNIPNIVKGAFEVIGSFFSSIGNAIVNFFKGLNISLPLPDMSPILGAFDGLFKAIEFVIDALDLDFIDLGITIVGIAACFVNPAWGAAILAFEAITIAIRAIGWAASPCVEQVDALADVSEETASRFGTSLDSMNGAINQIAKNDFSNAVVSDEDVDNITNKVEDIKETILNNLDVERNKELAAVDALKGFLPDDRVQEMKDAVNDFYDDYKEKVTEEQSKLMEIYGNAASEHRDLTDEEAAQCKQITSDMYNQLIETSGASEKELESIKEATRNNDKQSALSAAESVIQSAISTRDEQVKAAWDTADAQKEAAKRMVDNGTMTTEEYDRIAKAADTMAQGTTNSVNDMYYGENGIVEKTKKGLGDYAGEFDFTEGRIKTNFEKISDNVGTNCAAAETRFGSCMNVFSESSKQGMNNTEKNVEEGLGNVESQTSDTSGNMNKTWSENLGDMVNEASSKWSEIKSDFKGAGEILSQSAEHMKSDISSKWNDLWSSAKSEASSKWSDLKSGWDDTCSNIGIKLGEMRNDFEVKMSEIGGYAEGLKSDIGYKFSEAWGSITGAFSDAGNWFYWNVIRPIEDLFSGIHIDFPNISLPHINWNWHDISIGDLTFGIPSFWIDWYASGGFPRTGSLFMANENGPEMVGTMGGRTAVANNEQIIEGIKAGVMDAIISVSMMQSNSDEGTVEIPLVIGNEELARATIKGMSSLKTRGILDAKFL